MAKISVSKTVKVGVGKFECVDINASIEFDVPNVLPETVASAYTKAYSIVDDQINTQLGEIQGIMKPDSVFKQDESKSVKPNKRR